jgi:hypothetical protein
MWYSEDNPSVEIGYNGGYVDIFSISEDSLTFIAEMVCGPTYHIAYAEGTAYKVGTNYVYKYEDECEITISFSEKKLKIIANKSFECGFGARAYMDHELYKAND